ncbi:MAG TPA: MEDS domain-containing protein [Candidatus Thermoplasmatota archaeon]|nr:MEDS domain-containing protein [Candidatus Thermoplasmatota archaeon]
MDDHTWSALASKTAPGQHLALLYRDEAFLARGVAAWAAGSLVPGGAAILVGTPIHAELIRNELRRSGFDVPRLEREGRLLVVDADWLMAQFILDGKPTAASFDELVRGMITRVRDVAGLVPIRAWGEMVSLLRVRNDPAAAQKLESMWNAAIDEHGIALLCSYSSADDGPHGWQKLVDDVTSVHTHIVPESGLGFENRILEASAAPMFQ